MIWTLALCCLWLCASTQLAVIHPWHNTLMQCLIHSYTLQTCNTAYIIKMVPLMWQHSSNCDTAKSRNWTQLPKNRISYKPFTHWCQPVWHVEAINMACIYFIWIHWKFIEIDVIRWIISSISIAQFEYLWIMIGHFSRWFAIRIPRLCRWNAA